MSSYDTLKFVLNKWKIQLLILGGVCLQNIGRDKSGLNPLQTDRVECLAARLRKLIPGANSKSGHLTMKYPTYFKF